MWYEVFVRGNDRSRSSNPVPFANRSPAWIRWEDPHSTSQETLFLFLSHPPSPFLISIQNENFYIVKGKGRLSYSPPSPPRSRQWESRPVAATARRPRKRLIQRIRSCGSVGSIWLDGGETAERLRSPAWRLKASCPEVREIRLVGSIARGDHTGTSDSDIRAFLGRSEEKPVERLKRCLPFFELEVAVDALSLTETEPAALGAGAQGATGAPSRRASLSPYRLVDKALSRGRSGEEKPKGLTPHSRKAHERASGTGRGGDQPPVPAGAGIPARAMKERFRKDPRPRARTRSPLPGWSVCTSGPHVLSWSGCGECARPRSWSRRNSRNPIPAPGGPRG